MNQKLSLQIVVPKKTKWIQFQNLEVVTPENQPEKKHYRGVRQWPWGKFVVEIHDPNKCGSRVWLRTLDTTIKANKAYNQVIFRLHGSKANLNFPLEVNVVVETVFVITADSERKHHREEEEVVVEEEKVVVKKEKIMEHDVSFFREICDL